MTQDFIPFSASELKVLCRRCRIWPSKDRGQHFIVEPRVVEEAIGAAEITARDEVIEIGPGFGALTFGLAPLARKVTAVEIEPKLARFLGEECARRGVKNVEVVEGDILDISKFRHVDISSSVVVSSLPYSITSDFFSLVFNDNALPKRMVLMVQKEVVERLTAPPPHMSLLSVVAQWYGRVEYIHTVARSAFWPEPEVASAIVKIDARVGVGLAPAPSRAEASPAPTVGAGISSEDFFAFVRQAFKFPRRKVGNVIPQLSRMSLRAERSNPQGIATLPLVARDDIVLTDKRPSELSIHDWLQLYKMVKKLSN